MLRLLLITLLSLSFPSYAEPVQTSPHFALRLNPNLEIPQFQQHLEQTVGRSVFRTSSTLNNLRGTAVLVTPTLVLTNQHVLEKSGGCENLKFHDDQKTVSYRCLVKEFCSEKFDYCMLRIEAPKAPSPLPLILPKTPLASCSDEGFLWIIGNYNDEGIIAQAQQKYSFEKGLLYHCIETEEGNSGSPVVDQDGHFLGLHFARLKLASGCKVPSHTGASVSTALIIKELKKMKPGLFLEISFPDSTLPI